MDILFRSTKLQKECENFVVSQRKHGLLRAKKLRLRLDELRAANTLQDIVKLPQARCHELKQDRKGQIAVDLDHPYRLIFLPTDPVQFTHEGEIDFSQITSIIVIGIIDYHD